MPLSLSETMRAVTIAFFPTEIESCDASVVHVTNTLLSGKPTNATTLPNAFGPDDAKNVLEWTAALAGVIKAARSLYPEVNQRRANQASELSIEAHDLNLLRSLMISEGLHERKANRVVAEYGAMLLLAARHDMLTKHK